MIIITTLKFEKIIIGAGLYGLYSAPKCAKHGEKIIVLECDSTPFRRATYINRAQVHQAYYSRSLSTAKNLQDTLKYSIAILIFASIRNLKKFTQLPSIFLGQAANSLKNFVVRQISLEKKFLRENIFIPAYATELFILANIYARQKVCSIITWKNQRKNSLRHKN